jgi:hypothetical protein
MDAMDRVIASMSPDDTAAPLRLLKLLEECRQMRRSEGVPHVVPLLNDGMFQIFALASTIERQKLRKQLPPQSQSHDESSSGTRERYTWEGKRSCRVGTPWQRSGRAALFKVSMLAPTLRIGSAGESCR